MSAMRDALRAAGLPIDPRQSEHYQAFWFIEEPTGKWCMRCHELKPLEAFDLNSKGREGRHSWCKPCRRQYEIARKDAA